MNPEFLAMSYLKNSVITNLEPYLLVENELQCFLCRDTQHKTKLFILYLFKCLDSKMLYFWVQVRCQIHTNIPVPKKAT